MNVAGVSTGEIKRSWEMYLPATVSSIPANTHVRTLVLLGEAPGADEAIAGIPFIGASGKLLRETLLPEAGLSIDQFHVLNAFIKRPPDNNLELWTANKTEHKKLGIVPSGDLMPKKRYLLPQHRWQLEELDSRLRELKPDLIIAMGAVAMWAISGVAGISNYRGNFFQSRYGTAIGTFHPAAVLRQWSYRPTVWADLNKVRGWLDGTLPKPLHRKIWVNPSFTEIANVYALFNRNPHWLLGVDIETSPSIGQITCISFATAHEGICIPIWNKDASADTANFWPTLEEEVKAWRWIDRFARLPNRKVLQNGLYDLQYLMDSPIDIRVRHAYDDTAILQHALQPELQKALGYLSSIYLNEPSWKQMRTATKDENKADD